MEPQGEIQEYKLGLNWAKLSPSFTLINLQYIDNQEKPLARLAANNRSGNYKDVIIFFLMVTDGPIKVFYSILENICLIGQVKLIPLHDG